MDQLYWWAAGALVVLVIVYTEYCKAKDDENETNG